MGEGQRDERYEERRNDELEDGPLPGPAMHHITIIRWRYTSCLLAGS
jgi:hypothetical protein